MLNGLELAFAICAAIGGILLLGRLLRIGNNARASSAETDYDGMGLKLLSFESLTAFLTFFGIAGIALHRTTEIGAIASFAAGLAAGAAAAWLTAQLLRTTKRRRTESEFNPAEAIGQTATVYIAIPPGQTGKVTVTINQRLSVLDAIALDKQNEIPAGETVTVAELANRTTLIVRKV